MIYAEDCNAVVKACHESVPCTEKKCSPMNYHCIQPPQSLQSFVRCFWIFESNFDAKPYAYRSMADGCAELIFHYKGLFHDPDHAGSNFYSGLQAPTQLYKRYITQEQFGIFGAYLYPFTIPFIFDLSASSIANEMPGLPDLLGPAGKILEERMITAQNNEARLTILTHFLEKKLQNRFEKNPAAFSAIRHVIDAGQGVSVPALSEKFCMTERTLQRQFKEYAGLSPKLLSRISRFKASLNDYGNRKRLLTEIAHECGYYDQSHFITDFKAFSGYHPKAYFHGQPEGAEWRDA